MTNNSWHGKLDLVYDCVGGKTQLKHCLSQAPLKLQSPFYPEGDSICHNIILHTAGGIVGGDRLSQNIKLNPDTKTFLTTAAAAKIYKSNGQKAQQNIKIELKDNTYLEWFPQENIIFNGAIYQQRLEIKLAANANFIGWEINRFGRSARGEKFVRGEWRSHTEVWREGKPLWIDRQWLPGGAEIINSPHGLDGKAVIGNLVWLGEPLPPSIVERARDLWYKNQYLGEMGVTQTLGNGLLCRYRGNSSAEAKQWFRQIWYLLRSDRLQLPLIQPRVWT